MSDVKLRAILLSIAKMAGNNIDVVLPANDSELDKLFLCLCASMPRVSLASEQLADNAVFVLETDLSGFHTICINSVSCQSLNDFITNKIMYNVEEVPEGCIVMLNDMSGPISNIEGDINFAVNSKTSSCNSSANIDTIKSLSSGLKEVNNGYVS